MESFKEIIDGNLPVLVDFFATWCGPCKMMHPTIETLGKELAGKARVLKIDIDKNQALANHYQIQSVPTLMVFQRGEIKWRNSGVMDKQTLLAQMENYMK